MWNLCNCNYVEVEMATIWFLRDGSGNQHTSKGHEVSMVTATSALQQFDKKYSLTGPNINAGTADGFAPFKHVVLEVEEEETNPTFPKPGYYIITGLSVKDCLGMFGIPSVLDV